MNIFLFICYIFLQEPASFFYEISSMFTVYMPKSVTYSINRVYVFSDAKVANMRIFWGSWRPRIYAIAKFLLKLIHGYKFYFTIHYFFIYSMQFKTSILLWWLSTTSRVTKLGRFSSITGLKYSCTSKIMAEFQARLLF